MSYPAPRYGQIILIDPASFEWRRDDETPGVWRKRLGRFSERDVVIDLIRLDAGSALSFGHEPAAEVAFLEQGQLAVDDVVHPSLSAFGSSAADQPEVLTATEDCELLYVKLPTFGGSSIRPSSL